MRGIDYSPAGFLNTFKMIKNKEQAAKIFDELGKEVVEDIHLSEDTEDYHCVDAYFGCTKDTTYCIENLILFIFRENCEET